MHKELEQRPYYQRNLPHWHPRGAMFFVTMRLNGTLPRPMVEAWAKIKAEELEKQTEAQTDETASLKQQRRWFKKFEEVLDKGGIGPTWLKHPEVAACITDSLHFMDGKIIELDTYCLMPNHLHCLFKQFSEDDRERMAPFKRGSLPGILHSLKSYTATKANRVLGRENSGFWASETFDHWVRNPKSESRIAAYILNNPVKAGLVDKWQDWPWCFSRTASLPDE